MSSISCECRILGGQVLAVSVLGGQVLAVSVGY